MRRAISADDRRSVFALVGFLGLCFGVAALGSAVTLPAVRDWYPTLAKPGFTPPNWLFGPVWTVLYAAMAVAAWRAWRTKGSEAVRRLALRAFALQLGLNLAWSFAFFGAKSLVVGLIIILLLEAAILWTTALFARLDRLAAWLMAPYAAWVAYAAVLNISILRLN
jgi:tryptophan-rich sensory protein